MRIKNCVKLDEKRFDCEIEHPVHGWTAFTAVQDDVVPLGRLVYEEIKASGDYFIAPPQKAPEEEVTIASLLARLEAAGL